MHAEQLLFPALLSLVVKPLYSTSTQPAALVGSPAVDSPLESSQSLPADGLRTNCSAQMEVASTSRNVPCSQEGCSFIDLSGQPPNSPCFSGNHQIIVTQDYKTFGYNSSHQQLPLGRWLLLQGTDGTCQGILSQRGDLSSCIRPGFCGNAFPWYLHSDTDRHPFGQQSYGKLCMTDLTSRGTAVCCQLSINVIVMSCGFYSLYKLEEALPYSATGSICTAALTEINSTDISDRYLVKDSFPIPKALEQLSDNERGSLVTVTYGIILLQRFKSRLLLDAVHLHALQWLNDIYLQARRSYAGEAAAKSLVPYRADNIKTVLGSPQVVQGINGAEFTYTCYVESDDGEILPSDKLRAALTRVPNTEFTGQYAFRKSVIDEPSSLVEYLSEPTESPSPPTIAMFTVRALLKSEKVAEEIRMPWIPIIVIVGVTSAIVMCTLLALGVYRYRQHRSHRIGVNSERSNKGTLLWFDHDKLEIMADLTAFRPVQTTPSKGHNGFTNGHFHTNHEIKENGENGLHKLSNDLKLDLYEGQREDHKNGNLVGELLIVPPQITITAETEKSF